MSTQPIQITSPTFDPSALDDSQLVIELKQRVAQERHATADVIRCLIEFDRRRLYLAAGMPSIYAYCTQRLNYSEYAAFNRIVVARAAARFPQLLASIEDGSLHLSGARLLAPHLTEENLDMALVATRDKSKREIEEFVAGLAQQTILTAVAAEQYRLHLTISRAAHDTLRQVQALLSHQLPDGNVAVIFERGLKLLLADLQRKRMGAPAKPPAAAPASPGTPNPPQASIAPDVQQPSAPAATVAAPPFPPVTTADPPKPPARVIRPSRAIPRAVKREVWHRDGARCAFVGTEGRCTETHRLQFHHRIPYAVGGPNTASNIELRCQPHNIYEAEQYFGADVIAEARAGKAAAAAVRTSEQSPPAAGLSPEKEGGGSDES